jgi:putative ABC transport system permease protein
VLTLALGVGSNTAVFGLFDRFLLRPLPYPDAGRLFQVFCADARNGRTPLAPADYLDIQAQARTFHSLAAYEFADTTLTGDGPPQRLSGLRVSGTFFQTVRVQAMRGRVLAIEDDQPGQGEAIVLSHGLWKRRFAGDVDILGRTLTIDGHPTTVVGVLPARFDRFLQFRSIDVWRPLVLSEDDRTHRSTARLQVLGRLDSRVAPTQAVAELNTLAAHLAPQKPGQGDRRVEVVPLRQAAIGAPEPILLLMGAVVALLLIVCVNLANLLLARATGRDREMAVRSALGASRRRLLRQGLVESLMLAGLGGLAGLILAVWTQHWISASIYFEGGNQVPLELNGLVLGFNLAVSVCSGLICGLIPAVRASRTDLSLSLREGARGLIGARPHQVLRRALVGVEVGFAVVLLGTGAIFVRGFVRLQSLQPGFDSRQRLVAQVSLPQSEYFDAGRKIAFLQQLVERVEALPGVEHASVATGVPLKGGVGTRRLQAEAGGPETGQEAIQAHYDVVGPHYFRALGIPCRQGREFAQTDVQDVTPVAIINESLARRLWPDRDPIGRLIAQVGDRPGRWLTIVGVVGDVRYPGNFIHPESAAHVYLPYGQEPWSWVTLIIQCRQDPALLGEALRHTVQAIDPDLPVNQIETLDDAIAHERNNFGLLVWLLGILAGMGFFLALLGVYGVVAYDVAQRTHELGIRAALGGQRGELLRLVTRQGMIPVGLGLGIGGVGAWAVARLLGSLLPSLAAGNPSVLAGTMLGLALAAWLACVIPASRVVRIDPMKALRCE